MSDQKKTTQVQKTIKYCLFCRLDITNLLHVQCIESCCRNVDQCLHCFSIGIEFDTHLPSHRYKLISSTSIPVFTDDWGADEELALLEAVEKCGLGNWTDIASYVGKSEHICEAHYFNHYIFSPFSPLPDLTQPYPAATRRALEANPDHNIDLSTLKFEQSNTFGADGTVGGIGLSSSYHTAMGQTSTATGQVKKPKKAAAAAGSNAHASWAYEQWYRCRLKQAHFEKPQETSRWKLQQMEFKGQLKNNLSLAVGYLPQRHDYEVEYLNDAEKDIADMDFRPDDTTIERELKLRVLELYNHVLDERIERKEFIDRYQLLVKRDRKLTREEHQVYKSLRPFARYLEAEDFDELVRSIVVERSLRLRIEQLQTYRLNGIQTLQDGMQFDLDYHQIMSEWESIHKKKWLDATTIPVGQYDALKNVLKDLDNELDGLTKQVNNDDDDDQQKLDGRDYGLDIDDEGRPMVRFVNGYPTLSTSIANGGNTRMNMNNTTTKNNNNNNDEKNNPFKANVLPKNEVPSFFSANSQKCDTTTSTRQIDPTDPFGLKNNNTTTTTTNNNGQVYEKSIPITTAQSRLTNCPCVATGGTTVCLFNIKDYPHAAMLSQAEQLLCKELHLLPQHYLVIKDQLIKEAVQNGYITQGVARNVLKVDVHVTDRVLNFCISQNIVPSVITP